MPGSPPPAPPAGPGSVPDIGTPPPAPPGGGGGIQPEIGIATGALLGPAALGSLAKAVQRRAAGEAPTEGPYWFYVEQPTPMLALEEYRHVGTVAPGSWYLAKGTYGDWIHAASGDASLEGWVAARAAKAAPSP
jgi:hypothetical protein